MALKSGTYDLDTTKEVLAWPAPDKDGDGDPVRVDDGTETGTQDDKVDSQGNVVKRYNPPKGFKNVAGFDGSPNWVRVDDRGNPVRNPVDGSVYGILEGGALVTSKDGTTESLSPAEAKAFAKVHVEAGSKDTVKAPEPVAAKDAPASGPTVLASNVPPEVAPGDSPNPVTQGPTGPSPVPGDQIGATS